MASHQPHSTARQRERANSGGKASSSSGTVQTSTSSTTNSKLQQSNHRSGISTKAVPAGPAPTSNRRGKHPVAHLPISTPPIVAAAASATSSQPASRTRQATAAQPHGHNHSETFITLTGNNTAAAVTSIATPRSIMATTSTPAAIGRRNAGSAAVDAILNQTTTGSNPHDMLFADDSNFEDYASSLSISNEHDMHLNTVATPLTPLPQSTASTLHIYDIDNQDEHHVSVRSIDMVTTTTNTTATTVLAENGEDTATGHHSDHSMSSRSQRRRTRQQRGKRPHSVLEQDDDAREENINNSSLSEMDTSIAVDDEEDEEDETAAAAPGVGLSSSTASVRQADTMDAMLMASSPTAPPAAKRPMPLSHTQEVSGVLHRMHEYRVVVDDENTGHSAERRQQHTSFAPFTGTIEASAAASHRHDHHQQSDDEHFPVSQSLGMLRNKVPAFKQASFALRGAVPVVVLNDTPCLASLYDTFTHTRNDTIISTILSAERDLHQSYTPSSFASTSSTRSQSSSTGRPLIRQSRILPTWRPEVVVPIAKTMLRNADMHLLDFRQHLWRCKVQITERLLSHPPIPPTTNKSGDFGIAALDFGLSILMSALNDMANTRANSCSDVQPGAPSLGFLAESNRFKDGHFNDGQEMCIVTSLDKKIISMHMDTTPLMAHFKLTSSPMPSSSSSSVAASTIGPSSSMQAGGLVYKAYYVALRSAPSLGLMVSANDFSTLVQPWLSTQQRLIPVEGPYMVGVRDLRPFACAPSQQTRVESLSRDLPASSVLVWLDRLGHILSNHPDYFCNSAAIARSKSFQPRPTTTTEDATGYQRTNNDSSIHQVHDDDDATVHHHDEEYEHDLVADSFMARLQQSQCTFTCSPFTPAVGTLMPNNMHDYYWGDYRQDYLPASHLASTYLYPVPTAIVLI